MTKIPVRYEIISSLLLSLLPLLACRNQQSQVLVSRDRTIQITIPSSWQIDPLLHHSAELQASNRDKGLYVIVLSENKKNMPNLTLEGHSQITRAALLQKIHLIKMSQPKKMSIMNYPALQVQISANVYGYDMTYLHTSVETAKGFHQIICWTSAAQFEQSKDALERVVFSFRELSN